MQIGILGGTFDPIHKGHIEIAKNALSICNLDKVIIMVAANPPHKTDNDKRTPADIRFEMTKNALEEFEYIEASDIELHREGKSYTVDTLHYLKEIYPDDDLCFIVGGDMLLNLPKWYHVKEIFSLAKIIAFIRKGIDADYGEVVKKLKSDFSARIELVESEIKEVSSTEIRNKIHDSLPVDNLITSTTEEFIHMNMLYLSDEIKSLQEKVKPMLTEKRYIHTISTAITSIKLANKYGADTRKAHIASILHDCAKYVQNPESLCEKYGITLDKYELQEKELIHAKLGSVIAKNEFHIEDDEIINAIRYHTTGKENMTTLEKVIYLADAIEPHRKYDGVKRLRQLSMESLDEAVIASLEGTIHHLNNSGSTIHPDSIRAYEYLKGQEK